MSVPPTFHPHMQIEGKTPNEVYFGRWSTSAHHRPHHASVGGLLEAGNCAATLLKLTSTAVRNDLDVRVLEDVLNRLGDRCRKQRVQFRIASDAPTDTL